MGLEPLAVQGVPVAGVDRAIGVLDDDAMDGQIDVGGLADSEVAAEGGAGDFFDLGGGITSVDPFGIMVGLSDEPLIELGSGDCLEIGML